MNSRCTSAEIRCAARAAPPEGGTLLADAHLHPNDPRLAESPGRIFAEARVAGIGDLGVCGTSPADWPEVSRVACAARAFSPPIRVHPSFGVHPWHAGRLPEDWRASLETCLLRHPGAGVGEIGLDASRPDPPLTLQKRVFEEQLALACRLGRAVSMHAVRTLPAALAALRAELPPDWAFLVHDCRASAEQVREIERLGGYVSCGPALLDPHARRAWSAAREASPERLLVETDAAQRLTVLVLVVEALARLRGWTPAQTAARTTENARRFSIFQPQKSGRKSVDDPLY